MRTETESLSRLFRGSGADVLRAGNALGMLRALEPEKFEGRRDGRARIGGGAIRAGYGKKLAEFVGGARKVSSRRSSSNAQGYDLRQRAVVKIHYFSHLGGGSAALRAHARYIARDAAARTPASLDASDSMTSDDHVEGSKPVTGKSADQGVFYDPVSDSVDGGKRVAQWARNDLRHFRLILAPENGTRLGELKNYTREVMRRAEAALGTRLQWVAVDHWDTDNPHAHIILRGIRGDGSDLTIPREFVQHGFRSVARDVSTERLGGRTREDNRLALQREVRAHRVTRLDHWIAEQVDKDGNVRIADLRAPNDDPNATDALKGRAHELRRLGLATEVKRNVLLFQPNWRDGLKALELHLDIRKALMQSRTIEERALRTGKSVSTLLRGPDR